MVDTSGSCDLICSRVMLGERFDSQFAFATEKDG